MGDKRHFHPCKVIECSRNSFRAKSGKPFIQGCQGQMFIDLGLFERVCLRVSMVRPSHNDERVAVFRVEESDPVWVKFVSALQHAGVHGDLQDATRFLSGTDF
jgi:hypothetical protein